MAANSFPSVINDFNVYKNGTRLIGITGEVTLPEFNSKTTTINGAGILGDIDEAVLGQFEAMSFTIPFRTLSDDVFTIMDPMEAVDLTIRGAIQCTNLTTGVTEFRGMRVVVRGKLSTFAPGNVQNGEQMGSSVTLSLTYILIEVDGETKVELDKLNGVYVVNGVDLLAEVKSFV